MLVFPYGAFLSVRQGFTHPRWHLRSWIMQLLLSSKHPNSEFARRGVADEAEARLLV
jgi:hypothetical protein